jgi:hypothetical protein
MLEQIIKLKSQKTGILDGFNSISKQFRLTEELMDLINYDGAIHNLISFVEGETHITTLGSFRLKKYTESQSHFLDFMEHVTKLISFSIMNNYLIKVTEGALHCFI